MRRLTGELGQLGEEDREGGGTVDGDDPGVAADVAELIVVGAGKNLAAEAAHEADPGEDAVVGVVVGAGGGGDRVGGGGGGVELRRVERGHLGGIKQ